MHTKFEKIFYLKFGFDISKVLYFILTYFENFLPGKFDAEYLHYCKTQIFKKSCYQNHTILMPASKYIFEHGMLFSTLT